MLTPQEKWFFDHHGFIILPKVVPPEDIERMIELGNRWHETPLDELPPPLTSTSRNGKASPTIAHWINHIQYGDPVFQRLVLNREIMRVIIALTRATPCLVDCALTKNYTTSDDIHFHAAGQDYSVDESGPRAGFLNAGISLVDVPEGTGFVCLPGSHKRNFDPPERPLNLRRIPYGYQRPCQRGRLCHLYRGTLPRRKTLDGRLSPLYHLQPVH